MTTSLTVADFETALQDPERLVQPTAWVGHIPFAFWIVDALRPRMVVELGVHSGNSYCAMCQQAKRVGLAASFFAVDTWRGDEQAGCYGDEVLVDLRAHHDPRYGVFSRLVQSTFVEALDHFADGSIDLLHIDGFHTYEAVRKDFDDWQPKLSNRAVVMFHDINVREGNFGVWRFWHEIAQGRPHFSFLHSHGLGVVAMGLVNERLGALFSCDDAATSVVRQFFGSTGNRLARLGALEGELQHLEKLSRQVNADNAALHSHNQELHRQVGVEVELRAQLEARNSGFEGELQHLEKLSRQVNADNVALHSNNQDLHRQVGVEAELRTQLEALSSRFADMHMAQHGPELARIGLENARLSEEAARTAAERDGERVWAAEERARLEQHLIEERSRHEHEMQQCLEERVSEQEQTRSRQTAEIAALHAEHEKALRETSDRLAADLDRVRSGHADEVGSLRQQLAEHVRERTKASRALKRAERIVERLTKDCSTAWDRYGALASAQRVEVDDRPATANAGRAMLQLDPDTLQPIAATELLLDGVEAGDPFGYTSVQHRMQHVQAVVVGQHGATSPAAVDRAIRAAAGEVVILRSAGDGLGTTWVQSILAVFAQHPLTFGVGAPVVGRDGRIAWSGFSAAEKGALQLQDAGLVPDDSRAQSATLLPLLAPGLVAFARDLYIDVGGFDLAYEDLTDALLDLSIRAREAGYTLRRSPSAAVLLGRLPDYSPSALARTTLPDRLQDRYNILASRRRPRLLIVYPTALCYDNDAGSLDAYWCLRIFQSLGYDVTFISLYQPGYAGRYTDHLRNLGVECPIAPQVASARSFIEAHGRDFNAVLLYRVVVAAFLVDLIRSNAPDAKVIFHTVDLHFLREQRQAELLGKREMFDQAAATKREELRCIEKSDATIVVSTHETQILNELTPKARHYLVPIMFPASGRLAPVEGRRGVLFVGGFGHHPNVDAVRHLCGEIWPLVRRQRPDEQLSIIGADATEEVRSLHDPANGVTVVGFVDDLAPYYKGMRVNVAPLRFGAGIKGKVLGAMMVGLPTVATEIAAEGMGVEDGTELLIGRTAERFAEAIVTLCSDNSLFQKLSDAGLAFAERNFSVDAQIPRMRQILSDLGLPH